MDLDDLKNGQGARVKYNKKTIAAYKDENGKIYAVSEKCTFEGCDLNWIAERKIWKCPCCGSEYSTEGKVLKGPATVDLEKITI